MAVKTDYSNIYKENVGGRFGEPDRRHSQGKKTPRDDHHSNNNNGGVQEETSQHGHKHKHKRNKTDHRSKKEKAKTSAGESKPKSHKTLGRSSKRSSTPSTDYFDNIFKRFSSIRIGNKSQNKEDTSSGVSSSAQTRGDIMSMVSRSRISIASSVSSRGSRGINSPTREADKKGGDSEEENDEVNSSGEDGGYVSDDIGKRGSKKIRRSRRPRDSEDEGEGGGAGIITIGYAIDADELIRAYDRTYIQMYPDERLREVADSHEHLRHWYYDLPATSSYRPRTSHELQWLDVHGQASPPSLPKKTGPSSSSSSPSPHRKRVDKYAASEKATPALHKAYLVQRESVMAPSANKPTDSGAGRESLLQMAASGSREPSQQVSPTKKEIIRMLYDTQDPTVDGVRRSSRK